MISFNFLDKPHAKIIFVGYLIILLGCINLLQIEVNENISIYSINQFISRLELSGYSAVRHKLFFLTELSRPIFFTAMLLIAAMFLLGNESKYPKGIKIFMCLFIGFLLFSIQKIFESFALTEEVPLALVAFGPSTFAILIFSGILLHIEDG